MIMERLSQLSVSPLVSIIIPSYNQGRFIRETIDSVLSQDYRPLEAIVVDGASTDETLDVLRSYGEIPELAWVSERDSGVVEAVNKGFALARGEIGAIQSSDDFYLPGAVRRGVEELLADPSLGFVYGDIVKIGAGGNDLTRTDLAPFSLEALLSVQTWVPQPSTFFRLGLAKSLGGWREGVPYAADTDLWFRMAFCAGARKIDAVLAKRRMHEGQRDREGERIARDYCRMIDTLAPLGSAAGSMRRAATAGKLMMKNRYLAGSRLRACLRNWVAFLLYPPLGQNMDGGALVPGWYAAHRAAARMKGLLFGKGAA